MSGRRKKIIKKHAADHLQSFGMYDAAVLKCSGIRAHLCGVRVNHRSFFIYVLMNKVLSKEGFYFRTLFEFFFFVLSALLIASMDLQRVKKF